MNSKKRNDKVVLNYPTRNEVVRSPHYAFRVEADVDGRVELSIDEGPWQKCRPSVGYWWFDWRVGTPGVHSARARVVPKDRKELRTRSRRFRVAQRRDSVALDSGKVLAAVVGLAVMLSTASWVSAQSGSRSGRDTEQARSAQQSDDEMVDMPHHDHAEDGMEEMHGDMDDPKSDDLDREGRHQGKDGARHHREMDDRQHGEHMDEMPNMDQAGGDHAGHHQSMHGGKEDVPRSSVKSPAVSKRARSLMRKMRALDAKMKDRRLSERKRAKLARQRARISRKLAREQKRSERRQRGKGYHEEGGHMMHDGEHMRRMEGDEMHRGMDGQGMHEGRMHDQGQGHGGRGGCGH